MSAEYSLGCLGYAVTLHICIVYILYTGRRWFTVYFWGGTKVDIWGFLVYGVTGAALGCFS